MNIRRMFARFLAILGLLVLANTAAGAPPQEKKAPEYLALTGTISQNGAAILVSDGQKLYSILNAGALSHLDGQLVTLKARLLPAKNQLYVTLVRAISAPSHTNLAKLDDAAFRR